MRVALQAGSLFHERYLIVKELGVGGMGSVYLAEQLEAKRKVALKIMHADFADSAEERQDRFMREFQVLSRLQHANIVTFYSAAITPEGTQYAVTEYITGKSLQEVLSEEKRLSWARMAKIGAQVCDAIIYAHENGVVHRDLKPANIMLLKYPEPDTVKVIDFGLAKITSGDLLQKLTQTGEIVGSPHYMSPEQILGKKVDSRTDLYALACIIFECLAGKRIFDDDTAISIIRRHVQEDPNKPIEREFSSSEKLLHSCLSRALAKDPNARYKSVAEFKEAFLDLCAAHEAGSLADVHKENRSPNKALLAALIIIPVALGAFALFVNQRSAVKQAQKSLSTTNITQATDNSTLEKLRNAVNRLEQRLDNESDRARRQDIYVELKLKVKKLWSHLSKTKRYEEELESQRKILNYADLSENPAMFKADMLENMAKTQMDLGHFDAAGKTLKEAETYLDKDKSASILLRARWHCAIARLQVSTHQFADARKSFMSACENWKHHEQIRDFGALFNDKSVNLLSHKKRFASTKLDDFDISRAAKVLNAAADVSPSNNAERFEYCRLLNSLSEFLLRSLDTEDAFKSLSRSMLEMEKLAPGSSEYKQLKATYDTLQKEYLRLSRSNLD